VSQIVRRLAINASKDLSARRRARSYAAPDGRSSQLVVPFGNVNNLLLSLKKSLTTLLSPLLELQPSVT